MKIIVQLPNFLKKISNTVDNLELEFSQESVKLIDVLRKLEELIPAAKGRIINGETPNRHITYYINDEDARFLEFGNTLLKDGDVIGLLSAIAGG